MPIIVGNRPIFRIRFGEVEIREVRRGTELKWGLYKIKYINKGPKDRSTGWDKGQNIPDYVWGYPAQSKVPFYFYEPDNATAVESKEALGDGYGYRSHSDGYFEVPECDELCYIPAITRNFHRDLTLFCKWRQRKYTWNGTYMWEEEIESISTIYVFKKKNGSGGYEDGYYDENKNLITIDYTILSEEYVEG